jgi:hypothetical protein
VQYLQKNLISYRYVRYFPWLLMLYVAISLIACSSGGSSGPDLRDIPNQGNTFDTAEFIDVNDNIEAAFHSMNDIDMFTFEVPVGGGVISIYTTGNMDSMGFLYDGSQSIISSDDDYFMITLGQNNNYNFGIIDLNLSAGIYYIEVVEFDGATGIYNLITEFVAN